MPCAERRQGFVLSIKRPALFSLGCEKNRPNAGVPPSSGSLAFRHGELSSFVYVLRSELIVMENDLPNVPHGFGGHLLRVAFPAVMEESSKCPLPDK